jgi:hypothetical protein
MTALAHERPETMPEIRTEPEPAYENGPDLDEVLRQAWKAMELGARPTGLSMTLAT